MSSNATHLLPPPSPSLSTYEFILSCFHSTVGICNIVAITLSNVLLLPVYVFILYLGHQQLQQKHSSIRVKHLDFITYHVVILELFNTFGSIICCCGVYSNLRLMTFIGYAAFPMKLAGQMLFNILTCVERYLAVVHPVSYLSLKTENGIRVRNIMAACIWVLSVASMCTVLVVNELTLILLSSLTITTCVLLICFFSISVLCVLTRPRPGEGTGDRRRVDQSKLRAFFTIMSILGLLLLRSGGNVLTAVKLNPLHLGKNERCGIWFSIFWFCLPSTLMLLFLFLQRSGKSFCKKNIKTSHILN